MAGTSNEMKLSLKIMVDMKANKVVFAEADKEFVDFIFTLMVLPFSVATKLLLQNNMGTVGCLGALYKSIETLDSQCYASFAKKSLLTPAQNICIPLLALHEQGLDSIARPKKRARVMGGMVYMVMDNLEVKPLSMSLIKSRVTDFNDVEEKHVEIGLQEGLAILKASLETTTVLTNVFLNKN